MYAIIESGARQYKVAPGDVLDVDLQELPADAKEVEFDRVLMIGGEGKTQVGSPLVAGAKVTAEIVEPAHKGPKLYHYFYRRRKHSRSKVGHRQKYLRVKIAKIVA